MKSRSQSCLVDAPGLPSQQKLSAVPLVSACKTQALIDSTSDANRETMAIAGFSAARVFIPETGASKAMAFSPVQTVEHFLALLSEALPTSSSMKHAWKHYRLALPVRMGEAPDTKYGLILLGNNHTLGMYGLGNAQTDGTVVPLLLVEDTATAQTAQQTPTPPSTPTAAKTEKEAEEEVKQDAEEGVIGCCTKETVQTLLSGVAGTSIEAMPCVGAWQQMLPYCGKPTLSANKQRKLRQLLLAGVPECLRGEVWMRLTNAHEAMHNDAGKTYAVCKHKKRGRWMTDKGAHSQAHRSWWPGLA